MNPWNYSSSPRCTRVAEPPGVRTIYCKRDRQICDYTNALIADTNAMVGRAGGVSPVSRRWEMRGGSREVSTEREDWDLFISYARLDLTGVSPIQKALESRGLRVWRDEDEIETFEAITQGVRDGVARSRVLLAYYSEQYPTRRACQCELTAAFLAAQRQGDPRERILVVNPEAVEGAGSRVDHIEPVQLRDAVFAVAPEPDDADGLADLADRIVRRLAGVTGSLGGSLTLLSRSFGLRPISSPSFVGRLPELWALHSALTAGEAVQITAAHEGGAVALTGVAGGGKSLLTEEYVLRFAAAWPGGVFWLSASDSAGNRANLDVWRATQLRTIAAQLQIPIEDRSTLEITADIRAFIERVDGRCLWVVDDFPPGLDADEVRAWFAPHANATTLLTSTTREYANLAQEVHIGGLSAADGYSLLTARRTPLSTDEENAAGQLVEALAGHPLAVAICGAELRLEAGMRTFAEYLASLADPSHDALELAAQLAAELPTGHEPSITATLLRSIELLDDDGRDLLRLGAALAVAPILNQLVVNTLAVADALQRPEALSRAKRAIAGVDRYSLAEPADPAGETRLVHGLVSRTIRFRDHNVVRAEQLQAAVSTPLAELIDASLQPGISDPGLQSLVAHGRALQLTAGPVSALGRIADSLARYDFHRGDYVFAVSEQEGILAIRRQLLGPDHIGTLTAERYLATTLRRMGELGRARELQEHVLQANQQARGDDDPQTALAMNDLAATLSDAGDTADAYALQVKALTIARAEHGAEDLDTLVVLGNLAGTFRDVGDLDTAQALEEQVLEARTRLLGPEHPFTLLAMNNLAGTLKARGDHERAQQSQEIVVEHRRRVLGEQHPDTLVAIDNLSGILIERGDLHRARELQEEVLSGYRTLYGDEAPNTFLQMRRLASTVKELGELHLAAELGERSLEGAQKIFGEDHPETMAATANLGQTLWRQGDYERARPLQETAFEGMKEQHGLDDGRTLTAANNLALTLSALGSHQRAQELQTTVVDHRRKTLGDTHRDTLRARLSLASMVRDAGDLGRAARLFTELRDVFLRTAGPDDPDTLLATTGLAGTLFGLGDYERSRQLQQLVVDSRRRTSGDNHPATNAAATDLARVEQAQAQGRFFSPKPITRKRAKRDRRSKRKKGR